MPKTESSWKPKCVFSLEIEYDGLPDREWLERVVEVAQEYGCVSRAKLKVLKACELDMKDIC